MGYPFGSTFYNTGSQQQRAAQYFQQNYTNTLYGPFGALLTQPAPYCQNCDCDGCKIHRERLRLQQEEAIEAQMHRNHVEFMSRQSIGLDEALDAKPGDFLGGQMIPMDVKPGLVTEEWWKKHRWKFYAFWALGVATVVQLFMMCATRQV